MRVELNKMPSKRCEGQTIVKDVKVIKSMKGLRNFTVNRVQETWLLNIICNSTWNLGSQETNLNMVNSCKNMSELIHYFWPIQFGGLNKNDPHRLIYLNAWSPVNRTT